LVPTRTKRAHGKGRRTANGCPRQAGELRKRFIKVHKEVKRTALGESAKGDLSATAEELREFAQVCEEAKRVVQRERMAAAGQRALELALYHCRDCNRRFPGQQNLSWHLDGSVHRAKCQPLPARRRRLPRGPSSPSRTFGRVGAINA
jgi:hypothetical protein